ncbi:hypothetical protein GCM10018791_27490 [Streptomyces zaomyceticus]|nr:hypothetical protein GCM10018791_27490 [Streptomyces zaomyceticus]
MAYEAWTPSRISQKPSVNFMLVLGVGWEGLHRALNSYPRKQITGPAPSPPDPHDTCDPDGPDGRHSPPGPLGPRASRDSRDPGRPGATHPPPAVPDSHRPQKALARSIDETRTPP